MSGRLGLATPWARALFDADTRAELEAGIPDGWTVAVSVSSDHRQVIAWPTRDGSRPAEDKILRRPIRQAQAAVRETAGRIALAMVDTR